MALANSTSRAVEASSTLATAGTADQTPGTRNPEPGTRNLEPGTWNPSYFSVGLPLLTQSFQPPSSARTFWIPRSLSRSAARALVNSFAHAQYVTMGFLAASSVLAVFSYSGGNAG